MQKGSTARHDITGQCDVTIAIGRRVGRIIGNETKQRQEFMPGRGEKERYSEVQSPQIRLVRGCEKFINGHS